MAETSGFFNAIITDNTPDRKYNANDYSDNLACVINNGVLNETNNLKVSASGMVVSVASGRGWINGHWYHNDDTFSFTETTAPTTGNRIDRVMLRLSTVLTDRKVSLVYVTGTEATSPTAPSPTRTSSVYDLVLADVYVAQNGTSLTVTDKRSDTTVCGWLYAPKQIEDDVVELQSDVTTLQSDVTTLQSDKVSSGSNASLASLKLAGHTSAIGTVRNESGTSTWDTQDWYHTDAGVYVEQGVWLVTGLVSFPSALSSGRIGAKLSLWNGTTYESIEESYNIIPGTITGIKHLETVGIVSVTDEGSSVVFVDAFIATNGEYTVTAKIRAVRLQ